MVDDSDGCGAKFNVVLVTDEFVGVKLLDRQRQVNAALKDIVDRIHALSLKTWTIADYEKKKEEKN